MSEKKTEKKPDRYIVIPADVRMHSLDGEPMFTLERDRYGKPVYREELDADSKPTGKKTPALIPWTMTFARFIHERLANSKTGASVGNVLLAASIRQSLRGLGAGAVWRLEGDEWEFLVDMIEKPAPGYDERGHELPPYDPTAAINLAGYFHATLSAATSPPAVAEAEAVKA